MFTVYAIYNRRYDKIYIGQTQDIGMRMQAHAEKWFYSSYTARYDGEWQLIHREDFDTRKSALKREKQLKSYRGRQFIKQKIQKIERT